MSERWAIPYADFLSLLLALFIALYAMSSRNEAKIEALKKEFIKIFDFPPRPEAMQPVTLIPPPPGDVEVITDGMKSSSAQTSATKSIDSIIQINQLVQEGGVLEQVEQGVTLRLPSNLLFEKNSAEITSQEMRDYIHNLAQIIKKLPSHVQINVRGYTDDGLIQANSPYKDHFSLAAARAKAVMNLLIANGVSRSVLSFSSYGENHPIVPNDSLSNRSKNNRVDLFLSADPSSEKHIRSLLDGIKK